jgi:hypothetical protein
VVRVILLASLFALVGLGTAAYAGCSSCVTSVVAQRAGTDIQLTFTASANDASVLPEEVTAVVMQVDGNRSKCLNVALQALHKNSEAGGFAVYSGVFNAYGTYSHSGRVDLAGKIYEFTVPLDGTAGKVSVAADQSPLNRNGLRVQVTAAPVTPAPTLAPASPAAPQLPNVDAAFLIGGALVLITIVGAYVDRRRSLARSLTA